MIGRRLPLLLPIATTATYLLAHTAVAGYAPELFARWAPVEILVLQGLSVTGSLLAVSSLDRGDYLRRVWALYLASSAAFLCGRLVLTLAPAIGSEALTIAGLAGNVLAATGSLYLARAFTIAGLELPGEGVRLRTVIGAAFVAAALPGIPALFRAAELAQASRLAGLTMLFSIVGDIVNLTFAAPILVTAAALRGGRLAKVWGLIGFAMLAWLTYDVINALGVSSALTRGSVKAAALGFEAAAGLTQWWVSRGLDAADVEEEACAAG